MKLSRIAEAAWGIFGKKALGKLACSGVDKYIAELCKQLGCPVCRSKNALD